MIVFNASSETSNLEAAGSSPAGRASFSAIFATIPPFLHGHENGTGRQHAAQRGTLASHSRAQNASPSWRATMAQFCAGLPFSGQKHPTATRSVPREVANR